jgi:hypothetical protein
MPDAPPWEADFGDVLADAQLLMWWIAPQN